MMEDNIEFIISVAEISYQLRSEKINHLAVCFEAFPPPTSIEEALIESSSKKD